MSSSCYAPEQVIDRLIAKSLKAQYEYACSLRVLTGQSKYLNFIYQHSGNKPNIGGHFVPLSRCAR